MSLDDSQLAASILIPLLFIIHVILFFMDVLTPTLLTIELFVILLIVFISLAIKYKSRDTSEKISVNTVLSIRNRALGTSIDTLTPNDASVTALVLNKTTPYNDRSINTNNNTLLNWSPLTVRLTGYLGGKVSGLDGVFDMKNGIKYALELGARSFVFDIDYLDTKPCQPVLINRDAAGYMRSLNTGSISDAMTELNEKAFLTNYDPVILVLYLRRIPPGNNQQAAFFTSIAEAMNPISMNHLGLTEDGNFHNCGSESSLFQGDIISYQKKFIVLCNYDTTQLPNASNPKDNLNFWINCRIWQDVNSTHTIGSVSKPVSAGTAYSTVGSTSDFLTIPGSSNNGTTEFINRHSSTYVIALGPVEEILTIKQLSTLLPTLGIQSIPMDIIRLGESPIHTKALAAKKANPSITDITSASDSEDPLSYWMYAGYYRFNTII